jgi:hypothetical protein
MALALALALTGCKDLFGLDEPGTRPDAPPPTEAGADARLCWGTDVQVCLAAPPTTGVTLDGQIDTAIDQRCRPEVDAYCAIAGTTVTVPTAATLDVRGARPLVVIATDTFTIDGVLDAGSHAATQKPGPGALATAAACNAFAAQPSKHGGGAGGSFAGTGGAGGGNDSPGTDTGGAPAAPLPALTAFRAGCAGQSGGTITGTSGLGGAPGGALYLVAGTSLTITGSVTASGAAGRGGQTVGNDANGGGGGGSGGMIVLDAPTVTVSSPTGAVLADGGGGGEGASHSVDGVDGKEATDGVIAAAGGAGPADHGGDGGAGSHAIALDGAPGGQGTSSSPGGGGGGGGGAGVVKLRQATTIAGGGVVSPAPR